MSSLTFEQVPSVLGQILSRLEVIERGLNNKRTNDEDNFLTIDQAAQFLRLAKPTIYAYVSAGTIPSMKRGRRLYFSKRDLAQWLRKGKRMTAAEADVLADTHLSKGVGR